MSEWISVKDALPNQYEAVWIFWKNRDVLLGCRCDEEHEPDEGWYSFRYDEFSFAQWWIPMSKCFYRPDEPVIDEQTKQYRI